MDEWSDCNGIHRHCQRFSLSSTFLRQDGFSVNEVEHSRGRCHLEKRWTHTLVDGHSAAYSFHRETVGYGNETSWLEMSPCEELGRYTRSLIRMIYGYPPLPCKQREFTRAWSNSMGDSNPVLKCMRTCMLLKLTWHFLRMDPFCFRTADNDQSSKAKWTSVFYLFHVFWYTYPKSHLMHER